MSRREIEREEKIMQMWRDGYTNADIAREFGLSRQAIGVIVKRNIAQKSADYLSEKQLKKIDKIIFPRIRRYLKEKRIKVVDFCKDIAGNEVNFTKVRRFLYGETHKTYSGIIGRILEYTGIPEEEAFDKEGEN